MRSLVILAAWAGLCFAFVFANARTLDAQVISGDACTTSCRQTHDACLQACGEGENPMDCEDDCNGRYQDCLDDCPVE